METAPRRSIPLGHRVTKGYKTFCESTSMHGFLEMYNAKSWFWVLFWTLVVAGSMAVTGFQVYQSVDQYINQSILTLIQPAMDSEVIYPPIRVCLSHWIYWIDWDKVNQQDISKAAVLYGLSYITKIYSSDTFDIKIARSEFFSTMKKHNYSTLSQFYIGISKSVDHAFLLNTLYYNADRKIQNIFAEATLVPLYTTREGVMMCYLATTENILEYFRIGKEIKTNRTQEEETKNVLEIYTTPYPLLMDTANVQTEELANYISDWIIGHHNNEYEMLDTRVGQSFNITNDYSSVTIPSQLFINGFDSDDSISLTEDVDRFVINVKSSAHIYRNSQEKPCIENQRFILKNDTCKRQCYLQSQSLLGKDMNEFCAARFGTGQCNPDSGLYAQLELDVKDLEESPFIETELVMLKQASPVERMNHQTSNIETAAHDEEIGKIRSSLYKKAEDWKVDCEKKCTAGCIKWTFDYSISTYSLQTSYKGIAKKMVGSKIKIEFPNDGGILMMVDTDLQSWENFVGNIGGLLGIWTGASILSIVQLVYLCCCADSEFDPDCCKTKTVNKGKIVQIKQVTLRK